MPDVQSAQSAPAAAPGAAPTPAPREDLSEHLSTLIDAMRQLAESQKTLVEAVKGSGKAGAASPPTVPADIGGDPAGGGARPGAVVDYSRLSPLQQITLGLSGATGKAPSSGAD